MNSFPSAYFPQELFQCYFEENTSLPLVVSPKEDLDLIEWARDNQLKVVEAIRKYGAITFSGFNLTAETFPEAFSAITGKTPINYNGDTPRDTVNPKYPIYKSTVVADGATIPLHLEGSGLYRKDMPEYISFYCVTPPKEGTGRTVAGNVEKITEAVRTQMPAFWSQMSTKKLTYISRYLPENSWRAKWIRWINPSFSTIKKRFGTEDKKEIEEKCRKEGLTCEWDGGWAVISRKGIPGVINVDGKTLFCNPIHLEKQNQQLCGGRVNYILARILLNPTSRSMQFDVKFDDETKISRSDAGKLIDIMQKHREGRDWKQGDLMVLNNTVAMHGKTPHKGARKIIVAMGGSVG